MKGIDRLSVIRHLSKTKPDWIHTELFRMLHKEDLWIVAYENIKSNKGALTPGSTLETMDRMSVSRLRRLRDQVVNESYQFKPVKEIMIPKPDGRKRALGLPTANDKVVQEVIRMILEAIYEPCFAEQSFGFRRGLGTHDALQYTEKKFRWMDWVIEGDIEGAYPTINHDRLCEILGQRIKDVRFMNLIRKLLKCGILQEKLFTRSKLGVPQGSIVSPILANIYYHELDQWVIRQMEVYNRPASTRKSPAYKQITAHIGRISKKMKELDKRSDVYKTLRKELKLQKQKQFQTPSQAERRIQIEYVRYADDWMIGVCGEKSLALQLRNEVGQFLQQDLRQSLHPKKTKLTNLRVGKAKFLGYEIYLPREGKISSYIGSGTQTTRRTNPELRLDLPLDRVLQRMDERGYIQTLTKGHRPISKKSYTTLQDIVIVKHFQAVWQGLENYYSGCTNPGKLQYIHYLLHMSCAMTLAHRHRSSSRKMFRIHGKMLKITEGKRTAAFPVRQSWLLEDRRWLNKRILRDPFKIYANRVSRSSLGRACVICHTKTQIEMHHVKHIRKEGIRYGGFTQQMALLNRKQVPLCRECHNKVHSGLYDQIRLKDLAEA